MISHGIFVLIMKETTQTGLIGWKINRVVMSARTNQITLKLEQEHACSSCSSVPTNQQLEKSSAGVRIEPKGVNLSRSIDIDQQSEKHKSMSRVSASVERELVHEQPTDDDASALAYLVRRRCPNTYLFFYGHALEDRVVRMTFIAKPTYSSRRKYLNDLLDADLVSLSRGDRKRWHNMWAAAEAAAQAARLLLRLSLLTMRAMKTKPDGAAGSVCSLELQSLIYFLLILDLVNLGHCACHAECLVF
ncbi:hypothetical protein ZEAMMB73_Zm00001d004435 [Zea mays]|uniref:Uncharacterized protein n=1 Tax=Zea mays TaxID=4577 RepID=A0A1D6EFD1_MAIZE|nr:hypothetical protein ZEAMMB73_Zm00001d004435 [Zea mays]ONM18902.1 hypothetical protein ZEAMMB73_Zm00001d004435 [Zea mays]